MPSDFNDRRQDEYLSDLSEEVSRRKYDNNYVASYIKQDQKVKGTSSWNYVVGLIQREAIRYKSDLRIVDFGCGSLRYIEAFDRFNIYEGIDISPYMINQALEVSKIHKEKGDYKLHVGGLNKIIDMERESYNMVISLGVLGEHCPFTSEIMAQLYRITKEDGVVIFTVVKKGSRRETSLRYKSALFVIKFLPYWLKQRLKAKLFLHEVSSDELENIARGSRFKSKIIYEYTDEDWHGTHYYCIWQK